MPPSCEIFQLGPIHCKQRMRTKLWGLYWLDLLMMHPIRVTKMDKHIPKIHNTCLSFIFLYQRCFFVLFCSQNCVIQQVGPYSLVQAMGIQHFSSHSLYLENGPHPTWECLCENCLQKGRFEEKKKKTEMELKVLLVDYRGPVELLQ